MKITQQNNWNIKSVTNKSSASLKFLQLKHSYELSKGNSLCSDYTTLQEIDNAHKSFCVDK
jgi:hypothetical protein